MKVVITTVNSITMTTKKKMPPHEKARPGKKQTTPMTKKEDVANSPDEKTDEDYPNFPHPPSQEEAIKHKRTN